MRYYIHPNGEVATEASNRQDKGTIGHMDGYYYAARYMALLDNDGEMAAICRLVERDNKNSIHSVLNHYLEDPSQWKELPPETCNLQLVSGCAATQTARARCQVRWRVIRGRER